MTDLAAVVAYVPQPSPDVDVYNVCQRIEAWAPTCDDVFTLKDNKAKLGAIDQYLAHTSKDGRNTIAATMRRLEVRIGEVLGATRQGQRSNFLVATKKLDNREAHDMRAMAANPDVVEKVIADSTDENPASRRKVIAAIKDKETPVQPMPSTQDSSPDATARRVATAKEMAGKGYTSKQIAAHLGLSKNTMWGFRHRHGVEVPADAIVGKTRDLDSARIVQGIVQTVNGIGGSILDKVDYSALTLDDMGDWVISLQGAIRSLTTLKNNLNKEITSRDPE